MNSVNKLDENKLPAIGETFEQSRDWEVKKSQMIEDSRRRDQNLAKFFGALALVFGVSLACLAPLKKEIPVVVRVDNATGVTDIISTVKEDDTFTTTIVEDKHWISKFIIARETYNWATLQADYDTVGLFSAKNVADEYSALFAGKNSLDSNKDNVTIEVKLLSVNPNTTDKTATVRFVTYRIPKGVPKTDKSVKPVFMVATLAYDYHPTLKMKESDRLINPLGFNVTSYRADPEMIDATQFQSADSTGDKK